MIVLNVRETWFQTSRKENKLEISDKNVLSGQYLYVGKEKQTGSSRYYIT